MNKTTPDSLEIALPEEWSAERRLQLKREMSPVVSGILVAMGVTELSAEFHERSEVALIAAQNCKQVQSAKEEAEAAKRYKDLRALRKEFETQAKVYKQSLDTIKKKILDLEKSGLEPIEKAEHRLKCMVDGFAMEQLELQRKAEREAEQARQRAEAEARRAAEEAARLAREKEDAERREQEAAQAAEKARIEAERANSPEAKAAAEKAAQEAAERQRQAEEAAAKAREQEEAAAMDAEMAAMAPAPPAPVVAVHAAGVSSRTFHDYEFVGRNDPEKEVSMIEFAKSGFGVFLKVEARRQAILDALKINPNKFDGVKGIRVFERVANTVR